jgi:hypothetical protein
MFDAAPSEAQWVAQLAGQTRLTITAKEAFITVKNAWERVVDELN